MLIETNTNTTDTKGSTPKNWFLGIISKSVPPSLVRVNGQKNGFAIKQRMFCSRLTSFQFICFFYV